ncbi:unnamed protein product [Closterium sp. Yama58-4]|nr:unnamed protein product [Closterium sp. Yama58-4]
MVAANVAVALSDLSSARTCRVTTPSLASPLVAGSRKCASRSAAAVGVRAAMGAAEIAQALSDKRVQPRGERLLVKLDEPEQKSAGGVLLPTQAVKYERYLTGQVVSAGEEVKKASVGQKIMFPDMNAYEVAIGDGADRFCFVREGDIMAVRRLSLRSASAVRIVRLRCRPSTLTFPALVARSAMARSAALWLLLLAMTAARAEPTAVRFQVEQHAKCVGHDLRRDTLVAASYAAVPATHASPVALDVSVTSPAGVHVYMKEGVSEGQLGFRAEESGEYHLCFWLHGHHVGRHDDKLQHVEVTWREGQAASHMQQAATKERVESFEWEVKRLEGLVEAASNEMIFFHEREEELRAMSQATQARVGWLSAFSLLTCALLAALQYWHLKTFFQRTKVL